MFGFARKSKTVTIVETPAPRPFRSFPEEGPKDTHDETVDYRYDDISSGRVKL